MRKRDRERLAKRLREIADDLNTYGVQQLRGAEWYFDNNADIKGFSFAHSATSSLWSIHARLEQLMDESLYRHDIYSHDEAYARAAAKDRLKWRADERKEVLAVLKKKRR